MQTMMKYWTTEASLSGHIEGPPSRYKTVMETKAMWSKTAVEHNHRLRPEHTQDQMADAVMATFRKRVQVASCGKTSIRRVGL